MKTSSALAALLVLSASAAAAEGTTPVAHPGLAAPSFSVPSYHSAMFDKMRALHEERMARMEELNAQMAAMPIYQAPERMRALVDRFMAEDMALANELHDPRTLMEERFAMEEEMLESREEMMRAAYQGPLYPNAAEANPAMETYFEQMKMQRDAQRELPRQALEAMQAQREAAMQAWQEKQEAAHKAAQAQREAVAEQQRAYAEQAAEAMQERRAEAERLAAERQEAMQAQREAAMEAWEAQQQALEALRARQQEMMEGMQQRFPAPWMRVPAPAQSEQELG